MQALGLNGGDGDHADDVGGRAAARQVVHRGGDALQHGSDCLGAAQTLGDLVADVAGVEVGEDKHVGLASDRGVLCLGGRDAGNHRGVELQLAVDLQVGGKLAGLGGCLGDERGVVVDGAALARERQHRHARGRLHERRPAARRLHGDLSELVGAGVGVEGAVGEEEGAVLAIGAVGQGNLKERGHERHARGTLENLQRRPEHVAGGVAGARDHAVGVAQLDHHDAEVELVVKRGACGLEGHALLGAKLGQGAGVALALGGGAVVDHGDAGDADLVGVAQHDGAGDALRGDLGCRLQGSRIVALGQDDALGVGLCSAYQAVYEFAH